MTKVGGLGPSLDAARLEQPALEKPFQANLASPLSGVAQTVGVTTSAPELPSSELVRFAPEKLWTDNAKVQFAWDLRDALTARISAKAASARSPAEQFLHKELQAIEAGKVDPRVATDVLFSLARGLSPGKVWLEVDQTATKILDRSLGQLRLALAELHHPKTLKSERVAEKKVKPNETAELGRAIVGELLHRVAGGANDAATARFAGLSHVPPFVWGQLAKAVGAESAEAFFHELAGAKPEEIEDCAGWLATRAISFQSMRAMVELAPPRADGKGTSAAELRALAVKPGQSTRLAAELEHQTAGLSELFGIGRDGLELQLRSRQRDACLAVASVVERAEKVLGARAGAVLARFDLEGEALGIASLKDGIRMHTDLDTPGLLRTRTEQLAARVGEVALHHLADDLRAAIERDPRLAPLAATFAGAPKGALHVQAALVGVLQWAMPAKDGEGASAYTFRVAEALGGPGALRSVTDRLATELAADREGLVGDLKERVVTSRELQQGAIELVQLRAAHHAKLERGTLAIGRETVDAIAAHMKASYPQEGMGYVATDGRATYFFPVKNLLADAGLGRDRGEDDPADVARLADALDAFGLGLLAKVHSHPDQSPVFSDPDLEGMRVPVALAPELRTMIMEVSKTATGELVHRLASFASQPTGQVRAEDRVEVT